MATIVSSLRLQLFHPASSLRLQLFHPASPPIWPRVSSRNHRNSVAFTDRLGQFLLLAYLIQDDTELLSVLRIDEPEPVPALHLCPCGESFHGIVAVVL